VDALPAFPVSAYWRLDARAAWRLTDDLQFELVGQNILDDSHREFGDPTDVETTVVGRSFYGRLTWRS
jgi:outer membrane receptor for monomeric catechols